MSEGLKESLSLLDFAKSTSSILKELGTPAKLVESSDVSEISAHLGFDSRRICGAHNIVVVSKCSDSLYLDTLREFVSPFLEDPEQVESFLVDVIRANPSFLEGTTIDQVSGLIRFRPHALNTAKWAEEVLQTL